MAMLSTKHTIYNLRIPINIWGRWTKYKGRFYAVKDLDYNHTDLEKKALSNKLVISRAFEC